MVNLQMLSGAYIYLDIPLIWKKFQFWRLFSNFLFLGRFSFPTLMIMVMLVQYSGRYEVGPFNTGGGGGTSDYAFMMIFLMLVLDVIGYFMELFFLAEPLIYAVMYVWSRRYPEQTVSFFGFQVQALYTPWVYVVFNLLIGSSPFTPLLGIAAGHIYYFLVEVVPDQYQRDFLKTPNFLVDWFGYGAYHPANTAPAGHPSNTNRTQAMRMPGGRQWGQGNVLGTS